MEAQTLAQFISEQMQKPENKAPFTLETPQILELNLNGEVWAKAGSMVAHQGMVTFSRESSLNRGWGQFFLKRVTAEGVRLMKVEGLGRVYLADLAKRIQLLRLNGEAIYVNGNDVLAFENRVSSKITMMRSFGSSLAGGLFNVRLQGRGYVAITSHGKPLALEVTSTRPVFTDAQATVAWSDNLEVGFHTDIQLGTLFGRNSGETFQLKFEGKGWVLIQPFEETGLMR
jgi:uncharacterized protein (AIM24 family)